MSGPRDNLLKVAQSDKPRVTVRTCDLRSVLAELPGDPVQAPLHHHFRLWLELSVLAVSHSAAAFGGWWLR